MSVPNRPNAVTIAGTTNTVVSLRWAWPGCNDSPCDFGQIDYSTSSSFTGGIEFGSVGTSRTTLDVTGLTPGTVYYFRFRAHNGNGYGAWSYTSAATTDTVPDAVPNTSISSINQTDVTVTWGVPDNNGSSLTKYEVVLSVNSNFSSPVYDNASVGASRTSLLVPGLTPNTLYYFRVRAANAYGWGAWSASRSVTTKDNAPAGPSNVVATYVSDTTATLTWTLNPTPIAAYDSQTIQRQLNGGSWVAVATVSGTTTTWTDTSLKANQSALYRIYASNSGGNSQYGNAANAVATTPVAPTQITAIRQSDTSVKLTWTNNVAYPGYQTVIQRADGVGGWVDAGTVATGVITWTDVTPNAVASYRLASRTVGTTPTLSSAWVVSPTVIVIAPPNAPSNLTPNGIVFDATQALTLSWKHNPADTSPQRQYQIRYALSADPPVWTELPTVASTVSSAVLPANTLTNPNNYIWQVRTWGVGPDPSPYSPNAALQANARPIAGITTPTPGSYGYSALTVAWTYFDAEGTTQAQWRVSLYDTTTVPAGQQIETHTAPTADTTCPLSTVIQNGKSYRVDVQVQDGAGLWSAVASSAFTVSYLPPAPVDLYATYDPDRAVVNLQLSPDAVTPGVDVAQTSVTVERSVNGGPWEVLAANVSPDAALTDFTPATMGTNTYRLTVNSATPSSAVFDPAAVVETCDDDIGWLSSGPDFADAVPICGDLHTEVDMVRQRDMYHFAGRRWPVQFTGQSQDYVVSVSGAIDGQIATLADLEALEYTADVVLWRDPTGQYLYGSISGIHGAGRSGTVPGLWDVSFTVTQTDVP